jgi:outer membrane protein insertion porin family/translocation and assembly module TamA
VHACARRRSPWALLLAQALALSLVACASIPHQRYALDHIEFEGNHVLGDGELEDHIASQETPRFLGLFPGVLDDYQVFDRYVLERDLERIERYYRAKGYYRARAHAARVSRDGRHVKVQIVIDEGPPVVVRRVDVHGLEASPPELRADAERLVRKRMRLERPFEEERMHALEERLVRLMGAHGYAFAEVKSGADVDLPKGVAAVGFWIQPGKLAHLGSIRIEGLGKIPEGPVARALDLAPGEPYSLERLEAARQAVLDLGVFSSVTIEPDLSPQAAQSAVVPLRVKVEVTKLRSVRLGGGVELDSLKADVHLTGGWEDRNFLGGFRSFLIEAVPGVVLYPTRLPTLEAPRRLLPQGRLRSEFRQPGFIEARTTGVLRAQGSIYPLLLSNDLPDDAPVLGYRELRGSAGLERAFGPLNTSLAHTVQQNTPFTYVGQLDPDLVPVLVSYPELVLALELTDKPVKPHEGISLRGSAQAAGVGGDARDTKVASDFRTYVPLGRKLTLATRASVGLLFPFNYGDTVEPVALTGSPGGASRKEWVRDSELMSLRGLFAGGPGSNRGYAQREIGPHGIVPFYAPGVTSSGLDAECATLTAGTPSTCDLPLGGFTLWEASLELRFPIAGAFSGAVFTDAADVAPGQVQFRFGRPHLSAGLGFRYDTPVGPVRLDVGYRIPHLQAPAAPDEGTPQTTFGLPLAFSFGIGEAF